MNGTHNRRVLLVDDTPAIHEDFRKSLAGRSAGAIDEFEAALFGTAARSGFAGFEVESAYQGEAACVLAAAALAAGRPFAVAFVDMRMPPGWDGARTIEHLWQLDPRLQVVICTAYSDHAWEDLLHRLDPTGSLLILKKPFDGIEVRQLAEALTRKWTLTRQAEAQIDQLELNVRRRTAEIAATNERLQAEILERRAAQQEIAASEARYRQLFNDNPLPMWVFDRNTLAFLAVNDAAIAHYGYSRAQFLAMTIKDIRPPEDVPRLVEAIEAHDGATPDNRVWQHRRADGSLIDVDIRAQPLQFAGHDARLVLALDITARRRAEARVRRLNRMVAVTSGINASIARVGDRTELFDAVCRVAIAQGQFALAWIGLVEPQTGAMEPVAAASAHGEPDWNRLRLAMAVEAGEQCAPLMQALQRHKPAFCADVTEQDCGCPAALRRHVEALGCRSLALLPLMLGGTVVAMLVLYAHEPDYFDDDEARLLVELGADISFALDHLEKDARLNYLAYYDVLTGLANRTLFTDRLQQALANPQPPDTSRAVMLLDLRRFRHVNAMGRHVGDALLHTVADRLAQTVAPLGTLARVSGDCFAIALTEPLDSAGIAHAIEGAVLQSFARPFIIEGQEYRVTVHIGIALYPGDGGDAETLYKNAEAALKRAKRRTEPFVFYSPEMNARVANALTLENKLRAAIEHEEFVLHYQPQIDAVDGRVIGVEALVRWQTRDMGLLMPGSFIAMAEDLGLIVDLGRFVLHEACRQLRAWLDAGRPECVIAVNVSAVQLHRPGFVAEVREAITRHQVPPHLIELEITESAIMESIERMNGVLQALKAIGVTVALDDFGTGYSSLSRLKRLPIDKLKIDQSFVFDLAENADDAAIVRTIIAMAHQLQKKVIAEGVETEAQLGFLQNNRCDECQGRLFGMPQPADVVEPLLGQRLNMPLWSGQAAERRRNDAA